MNYLSRLRPAQFFRHTKRIMAGVSVATLDFLKALGKK